MRHHHDQLTLLVITDETSPVRRLQIGRRALWRAAALLGLAGLVGLGLLTDYVRLRLERPDVAALRAEADAQQEEVARLRERVLDLDRGFAEIRELERKVRIIADLPPRGAAEPAPGHAAGPGPSSEAATPSSRPAGMGGEEEGPPEDELTRLARLVPPTRAGLRELVTQLEAKRERLASMPSILPTEGWVTSGFGMRVSPFTGRRQFHHGLDIAADYGTPIVAPARGRVIFAGRRGPLGTALVVDHGYGTRTTYGHAKELYVKKGDRVERGMRIATVGNTGRSTGPHLHYAVSIGGKTVDPRDYILE